jgi:hypothetical protein
MKRWEGGEKCIRRSFVICTLRQWNDRIEGYEVGGARSTNGVEEERV